jgi:hypothetical protein
VIPDLAKLERLAPSTVVGVTAGELLTLVSRVSQDTAAARPDQTLADEQGMPGVVTRMEPLTGRTSPPTGKVGKAS